MKKYIGDNAYNICKKNYNSIHNGNILSYYINSISNNHI